MSLVAGDRLGAYEIVGRIGAGGMGEVYRARDTRLDRIVAIKVLASAVAAEPDLQQRFEREARAVASLNHPHICVLHDVGVHGTVAYLVMEYLEGQALSERLKSGPLALEQVLQYAIQIAQALGKAHAHGLTHRDIKPANIMLGKSGVKLLDFGLAKRRETQAANDLTKPPLASTGHGMILGTLHYMAPEQMRGEATDERTDIFAFGILLYEMVTGVRAFEGAEPASIAAATLSNEPAPIVSLRAGVSPALDRLIRQCLAKNPDDRWQSARDVELELDWISRAPQSPSSPLPGSFRSRVLPWAVAFVAALAAVVLAIGYAGRTTAPASGIAARFEIATPPTPNPASLALSADGRQLVYAATTDGQSRLWLRRLDEFSAEPLSGTENAAQPFWAPGGTSIGFFAGGKLKRLDLGGGPARVIADAPLGRGASWGADDTIIFAPTTAGPLLRISAAGGVPRAVTTTTAALGSQTHRWPHFLPDGRHFVFLSSFGRLDTQGVFLGSIDGGEPARLLPDVSQAAFIEPGWLVFARDGKLFAQQLDIATRSLNGEPIMLAQAVGFDQSLLQGAFAAARSGGIVYRSGLAVPRQLEWLDRAGKTLATIGATDADALASPVLSPDGRRIALFRTPGGNSDLWIVPVSTGIANRFTFDAAADVFPVWASDGQRLIFSSTRNGPVSLFERAIVGGVGDQLLSDSPETRIPNDVSPDGERLVYSTVAQSTGVDLWVLPLRGSRAPVPVLQTPFDEMGAQVSPDGRWMAFESTASGRIEVYVCAFPNACTPVQASSGGGGQPRWSANGRELFYVSDAGDLVAAEINTRAGEIEVGERRPLFEPRLATGANIPGAVGTRPQYDVATDGRFLVNSSVVGAVMPPISVMLDWRSAIKQ